MNNNIMNKVIEFLKNKNFNISNNMKDGRVNSSINEDEIIDVLLEINKTNYFLNNKLILSKGKEREWYDFKIEGNDIFIPVNLKVSKVNNNTPDNTNCKLGIFYSLTGVNPQDVNLSQQVGWNNFFKKLNENLNKDNDINKDYYFLIVNKDDLKDIFYTSLKKLEETKSNANNLPFQVVWNKNRNHVNRSEEESSEFILNAFKDSIDKIIVKDRFYDLINVKKDKIIIKLQDLYPNIKFYIKEDSNHIIVYHNSKEEAFNDTFYQNIKKCFNKDKNIIITYDILKEYIKEV